MDYRLYAITDSRWDLSTMLAKVEQAVNGGISLLQYRPKDLETIDMVKQANVLQEILVPKNIPLIINDFVDVAKVVDAEGVHFGQDDMNPVHAREYLGNTFIIGQSIGNKNELAKLNASVVDYVGIGAVFPTATKTDAGKAIGINGFKDLRSQILMPVVAIGGITLENSRDVINAGADGVAVISGLFDNDDIESIARQFKTLF